MYVCLQSMIYYISCENASNVNDIMSTYIDLKKVVFLIDWFPCTCICEFPRRKAINWCCSCTVLVWYIRKVHILFCVSLSLSLSLFSLSRQESRLVYSHSSDLVKIMLNFDITCMCFNCLRHPLIFQRRYFN